MVDAATVDLPVDYKNLSAGERKIIRDRYVVAQKGKCMHCGKSLSFKPPAKIRRLAIRWEAFPPNFLKFPVHLQHDHDTGLTEGAVHAYCNAVLWQYHGR